ncbi:MAG: TRAM domain-containing protein [Candidatus Nanoarchaeia archaeon]
MDRNFGGNRGSRPMNRSGGRDGGFRPMAPPVNVGEEFDVKIEAVGEKGDGIAKKNGFVIFVPGVKEGQDVRVKVTRVLRKVGFGEVVGNASGPIKSEEKKPKEEVEEEETYSADNDSDNFGEEDSADDTNSDDADPGTDDFGDEEDK